MTLAESRVGDVVAIDAVEGERSFRRRLLELGLVPGTRVTFVGVAPLGDPLQLSVRGCQLSIRRSEALQIRVRVTDELPAPASLIPGAAVSA
ncbi:MAG TPA: ferrous iron transport protein A [Polyangiaceae bacterium]